MMAWSAPAHGPVTLSPPQQRVPARPQQRAMVALPHLSSAFGWRLHPIRGTYRLHSGIDIPGRLGTPVLASAGGRVRFAGPAGGYGNMIEIDHGNGLETRYAHLSRLLVSPGTPVAPGETIALMGSTGLSTGSHLHFEVRDHGRATNPLAWLGGPAPRAVSFGASTSMAREYRPDEDQAEPHISRFARARSAAPGPAGGGL
ncbi:MAG: M23 family metallopeptidase [Novosphingobium sp.]|nr:M23 family metallopeptidase [Novosphingobium sp.]